MALPLRYTFLNGESDLALTVAEAIERETGRKCELVEIEGAEKIEVRTNVPSAKVYEVVFRLKAEYQKGRKS